MDGILVIEMQKEFCYDNFPLFQGEMIKTIIPILKNCLDSARRRDIPIIYCNMTYLKNDYLFKKFRPHCLSGTSGIEVIDEIEPEEKDYEVPIYAMDAFLDSSLERVLRSLEVRKVFITGQTTDVGCLATSMAAFQRGFEVVLLSDCCASRNVERHQMALNYLKPFAKIHKADEAIRKL